MNRPARVALALLSATFACASAKPPHAFPGPAPTNAADRAMARFAERYLDQTLRLTPVQASAVGYHAYDDELPDLSEAGVARALDAIQDLQAALARIDRTKLSRSYAVDHDLVARDLEARAFWYRTLRPFTWDAYMYTGKLGAALYYLTVPPADPARWRDQLADLTERLEALPRYLAVAQARLDNPPEVFTRFAIQQHPGTLRTLRETLPPLFEPYPDLEARFEKVRPAAEEALERHQAFLEEDLLPRSNGDWRLGPKRFAQKLAHTLHTDLSPQAIYEGAERGLERARWQMYDVALPLFREAFPDDDAYLDLLGDARIDYVVGKVIDHASARHGSAASLFDDVEAKADRIRAWIAAADFVDLPPPTDRFVIEPTPPYLDGLAVAFYNPAPAYEPDRKKSFWISSVPSGEGADPESFLREYNTYILDALTIHEAFPGHYVQLYWSSHSDDASIVKRVLESGTMAEGWAMMIEQLMHEAGWGQDDPRQLLFHLKMRLRAFINAMIDVRLHTSKEVSPEALDEWALALMTERAFQEQAEAVRKLRRAKLTSTQLSTYYVGYREMLDLYRDLAAQDDVPPKQARMALVRYGTIPPATIRRLLTQAGLLDAATP